MWCKKAKMNPNVFYKSINGKMKNKETIKEIIKGGKKYQTAKEMSEIMNESSKTAFTEKEEFTETNRTLHC
ncbi:hypothetical protein E2C01_028141 [Portunus trituberculatus]|uniref:Uncharacterized protein n=1 Tax=Portunus trituberculatus TaxID=210409 RepID=A0A5B7EJQ5_PORTR|nr:hypothetical protein [Portunus trituberculatus]